MKFYEVEEMLKTKPIQQVELRVAVYVRVSTESEQQATSVVNQSDYYVEMVTSNPKWQLVEVYKDEGITGMSVKKREEFNRMIADAKAGKFDLVITKTVSRFARNTLDAIKYARELKSFNVGLWFHQDGVLTFDKDSEFKLTLMAAMAQNESEKKSIAVKFGLQQAIKRGTVFGFDNMWGYRKRNGKLVIDEDEAPVIRTIFGMYSTDQYSMRDIEKELHRMGYRNRKGNKISHVTISKIIQNPKYKGYYVGGKVLQTDIFEKKFIILPEENWVMFKDETGEIVPAIIDEETWEKANSILRRRSEDVKNRKGKCNSQNLMTGKMVCVHCGRSYHRKDSGHNRKNAVSVWICAGKIQNGAASCPAKYLYEDELKHILFALLKETSDDFEHYMGIYEKLFTQMVEDDGAEEKRQKLEAEIEKLKRKKSKLLMYNADGEISDQEFLEMKREIDEQVVEKERERMKLGDSATAKAMLDKKLKEIRTVMSETRNIQNENQINNLFVKTYIDVIEVEVIDGVPHLRIKLMTGKVIERDIVRLRSGNTSNHILPRRSFVFNREDIMGRSIHKLVVSAELFIA